MSIIVTKPHLSLSPSCYFPFRLPSQEEITLIKFRTVSLLVPYTTYERYTEFREPE